MVTSKSSITKEKIITIHPASPKSDPMKVPYPYHIDQAGNVGRQEFWKGEPRKLIGFAKKISEHDVKVSFAQFWEKPERSIGLFPVFECGNEENRHDWFTFKDKIASVTTK